MNRTARTALAACGTTALLLLSACGGSDADATDTGSASSSTPTASSSDAATGPVINVTINGDEVTPSGERVDAKVGEAITINVTSDREGELHVHSTPEQELKYSAGKTTLELTIETPGVVDVEDHVADVVIAQLQVS